MVSCLYSTVHPITILTKTAPSCEVPPEDGVNPHDEENIPGKEPHFKKEIENENIFFDFVFCPKYFPSI